MLLRLLQSVTENNSEIVELFYYFINIKSLNSDVKYIDANLFILGSLKYIVDDNGWKLFYSFLIYFGVIFNELSQFGASFSLQENFMLDILSFFNQLCLSNQLESFIDVWKFCVLSNFNSESQELFCSLFGYEALVKLVYFNNILGHDGISTIIGYIQSENLDCNSVREVVNVLYSLWFLISEPSIGVEYFYKIQDLCYFLHRSTISSETLTRWIYYIIEKS